MLCIVVHFWHVEIPLFSLFQTVHPCVPSFFRFESLADVVKSNGVLCIPYMLSNEFLKKYPEAYEVLSNDDTSADTHRNTTDLSKMLMEDKCDAIVVTDIDYEAAGSKNNDFCTKTVIFRDEALLNINIIIPFGSIESHGNRYNSTLDRNGYDLLVGQMNRMIDSGCKYIKTLLRWGAPLTCHCMSSNQQLLFGWFLSFFLWF